MAASASGVTNSIELRGADKNSSDDGPAVGGSAAIAAFCSATPASCSFENNSVSDISPVLGQKLLQLHRVGEEAVSATAALRESRSCSERIRHHLQLTDLSVALDAEREPRLLDDPARPHQLHAPARRARTRVRVACFVLLANELAPADLAHRVHGVPMTPEN